MYAMIHGLIGVSTYQQEKREREEERERGEYLSTSALQTMSMEPRTAPPGPTWRATSCLASCVWRSNRYVDVTAAAAPDACVSVCHVAYVNESYVCMWMCHVTYEYAVSHTCQHRTRCLCINVSCRICECVMTVHVNASRCKGISRVRYMLPPHPMLVRACVLNEPWHIWISHACANASRCRRIIRVTHYERDVTTTATLDACDMDEWHEWLDTMSDSTAYNVT